MMLKCQREIQLHFNIVIHQPNYPSSTKYTCENEIEARTHRALMANASTGFILTRARIASTRFCPPWDSSSCFSPLHTKWLTTRNKHVNQCKTLLKSHQFLKFHFSADSWDTQLNFAARKFRGLLIIAKLGIFRAIKFRVLVFQKPFWQKPFFTKMPVTSLIMVWFSNLTFPWN